MTVIRFPDQSSSDYEFAFDIPHIPDLTRGYTDKDIFKLCEQVSLLRWTFLRLIILGPSKMPAAFADKEVL